MAPIYRVEYRTYHAHSHTNAQARAHARTHAQTYTSACRCNDIDTDAKIDMGARVWVYAYRDILYIYRYIQCNVAACLFVCVCLAACIGQLWTSAIQYPGSAPRVPIEHPLSAPRSTHLVLVPLQYPVSTPGCAPSQPADQLNTNTGLNMDIVAIWMATSVVVATRIWM